METQKKKKMVTSFHFSARAGLKVVKVGRHLHHVDTVMPMNEKDAAKVKDIGSCTPVFPRNGASATCYIPHVTQVICKTGTER